MNDTATPPPRTCADCARLDQSRDYGLRWCEAKAATVRAEGRICNRFESVWNKDLFGVTTLERMRRERLMRERQQPQQPKNNETTMDNERDIMPGITVRMSIAADFARTLLRTPGALQMSKRQLVDTAIAYTDMLARRLDEIPPDAQQRAEAGQKAKGGAL